MDFNRFDVSTKELVWDDPATWLDRFGIGPRGPVEVIDSDITTLSAAADKVIRVGGSEPYLVNIEFQSSHETTLARTLWYRQVALDYRHLLMGLRYSDELTDSLLEGVLNMHESATYEKILSDGRITEAQRHLLQGEIRFGVPEARPRSAIEAIKDIERLERMSKRILDADIHDWDGLLDER